MLILRDMKYKEKEQKKKTGKFVISRDVAQLPLWTLPCAPMGVSHYFYKI